MSQRKSVPKLPPDPPATPEEWAQVVVNKVSDSEETGDGDLMGSNSDENKPNVASEESNDEVEESDDENVDILDSTSEEDEEELNNLDESLSDADVSATAKDLLDDLDVSTESLILDLEKVTAERDQYVDASRRVQAEFENYRKQVGKRETEARARANEHLVGELLPVLDACDGALANGVDDVAPIHSSIMDVLVKQGLERIDPVDQPFDPEAHEAVMHEDADGGEGPIVVEVLRAGYVWKGRVIRPAMVRVKG